MFCTVADGSDSVDLVEKIGRLMLLFRLHWPNDADQKHMDLALIRVMEKPNRNTGGSFPLMRAERRVARADFHTDNGMSKLGELWTWARRDGGLVVIAIPVECLLETVPMMPMWQGTERKGMGWSVSTGVWRNNFTMDPRRRPPFKDCDCLQNNESE